jgi:hypothetical protein
VNRAEACHYGFSKPKDIRKPIGSKWQLSAERREKYGARHIVKLPNLKCGEAWKKITKIDFKRQ